MSASNKTIQKLCTKPINTQEIR